jgi:hypothetical protein
VAPTLAEAERQARSRGMRDVPRRWGAALWC